MVWVLRDGKPVRISLSKRIVKATMQARELAHWHIVRDAAVEGLSLEEAARRAGMKPGGVRSLCYKKLGSTRWPPRIEELQDAKPKS